MQTPNTPTEQLYGLLSVNRSNPDLPFLNADQPRIIGYLLSHTGRPVEFGQPGTTGLLFEEKNADGLLSVEVTQLPVFGPESVLTESSGILVVRCSMKQFVIRTTTFIMQGFRLAGTRIEPV